MICRTLDKISILADNLPHECLLYKKISLDSPPEPVAGIPNLTKYPRIVGMIGAFDAIAEHADRYARLFRMGV